MKSMIFNLAAISVIQKNHKSWTMNHGLGWVGQFYNTDYCCICPYIKKLDPLVKACLSLYF